MITSGRRNSGMPYFSTPPATCSASKMVTLTPLRARSPAQARPDGPEPMMAALFCAVESICGGSSQPRPMAASATKRSSRPMATGLNFAPTTQVASHCDSCGQTRPHTAGSALDVFRIWYERLMSRFCRAAMKPGISMPTGQPGTQRGFLQRRQRSASCSAPSRSSPSATSLKLWMRSSAGWCGMGARSGGMVLMFLGTRGPGGSARGSGSSHDGARAAVRFRAASAGWPAWRIRRGSAPGGLLLALEALLAERQLVEIHQVAVEIGAVHAGEFHLAADGDAAGAAHARCHPP